MYNRSGECMVVSKGAVWGSPDATENWRGDDHHQRAEVCDQAAELAWPPTAGVHNEVDPEDMCLTQHPCSLERCYRALSTVVIDISPGLTAAEASVQGLAGQELFDRVLLGARNPSHDPVDPPGFVQSV